MSMFYSISKQSLRLFFSLVSRHEVSIPEEGIYPGGAIIAANHASLFDPPLVAVSWPEPIHFLARKGLFEIPLLRSLITWLNAHPLGGKHDLSSIKLACKLLQEGKKVLVFPEGTRTPNGEFSPFKNGISLLAKRSGCPVIPTYIHGTYELWPRSSTFPRLWRQKTACAFGTPIWYKAEGEDEQDLFAHRIKREIEQLRQAENWPKR